MTSALALAAQYNAQAAFDFTPTILTDKKMLAAFHALHVQVHNKLSATQKHFLKRRNYGDLFNHVVNGHPTAVIYHGNQMVAQSLITFPDHPGIKNIDAYSFGDDMPAKDCVIVQTLGTHADFRGHRLSSMILECAEAVAEGHGRKHLMAKIAYGNADAKKNNLASFKVFQAAGFEIWKGPSVMKNDSYSSIILHKVVGSTKPAKAPTLKVS